MIAVELRGQTPPGRPVYLAAQHISSIDIHPELGCTIIKMVDGTELYTARKAYQLRQEVEAELAAIETSPTGAHSDAPDEHVDDEAE